LQPNQNGTCEVQKLEVSAAPHAYSLSRLFFSILYISAFTFGGGFVIVTFMKKKFVDDLHWLTEVEMLDITALAQSSPGAIAVNASILTGWRVGGLPGMVVATVACVIPPLVILSVISLFYNAFATNRYVAATLNGMQAGVSAVIVDVVINLGRNVVRERNTLSLVIMAGVFAAAFWLNVNVIYLILGAAAIGVVRLLVRKERGA